MSKFYENKLTCKAFTTRKNSSPTDNSSSYRLRNSYQSLMHSFMKESPGKLFCSNKKLFLDRVPKAKDSRHLSIYFINKSDK
ncbi:hypothetical protein CEXT_139801 [Caerostris extrusa]|uniref:Uncharacterized protein n=1 Tax=Caerostris extrusa TaxID=172846 RepID=A0AAV4X2V3_CAEEX|nr:hypothetical protein CEXT_139801 [Caerostris extrusa]